MHETPIIGAYGGSLFAFVLPEAHASAVTVVRIDRNTRAVRRRLPFRLTNFLSAVSVGRDGVYVGTAVIKCFSIAPDRLLRIDPTTLRIQARAWFQSAVAPNAIGDRLYASVSDGRVVRLDPRSLAVEASRQLIRPDPTIVGSGYVSKPAFGLGSLWAVTGNSRDRLELVRMDPATLAVRSRTRMPLQVEAERVVADSRHVYVLGAALARVDATGRLIRVSSLPTDFGTAAEIYRNGLVGFAPYLALVDARGRIVATMTGTIGGGPLSVDANDAWFVGDAGRGNGIVHVRLHVPR